MEKETTVNGAALWLVEQRTARRMSQRGLARELGVSYTLISDAEKGVATHTTWRMIAEYFKTPVEHVLRLAGFLGEQIPSKDSLIEQIDNDLMQMSPQVRKVAAQIIRGLLLNQ